MGIDPGFGSSKTAFTVAEYIDNQVIHVIYSKQFENSSTEMIDHAWHLIRKYNFNLDNGVNKVFVDASQPGFIRSLKNAVGEFTQYEYFVEKAKQDNRPLHLYMNIVPVNFSTKHRAMLGNVRKWIDKGHRS